jgi:hypothetical protein
MKKGIDMAKRRSEHARCRHCGHAAYAHRMHRNQEGIDAVSGEAGEGDCTCGCIHFEERVKNPEAGRDWVVQGQFWLKNKVVEGNARVKAMGQVGAIAKGLRDIKKDVVPSRAHVSQIKLTLIPVPSKKKE